MKNELTLNKAQYLWGETIEFRITVEKSHSEVVEVNTYQLFDSVKCHFHYEFQQSQKDTVDLLVTLEPMPVGNYGIEIHVGQSRFEAAFDVVSQQNQWIRYGFLSDFSNLDQDMADIRHLTRLHLNAVQFYDWMYTHDDLISKEIDYSDPLGRPTNLDVIRQKIEKCRQSGIRPFAYGAVYAASKKLLETHPEWGLYSIDKEPLLFFDWLNFMNIQKTSGWSDYIINEFSKAMKELKFQGIHMDTYGFPKTVCDYAGNSFSLADVFPDLIDRTYEAATKINPNNGVIFNCVNNWPVEKVAATRQDAIYIEVWPPHDTYFDLYRLIREAKLMSHKSVILAAYMSPFKSAKSAPDIEAAENALLMANAVINASGGTQLVFGEEAGILCDSYYAHYAHARDSFQAKMIDYADYLIRYADLLYQDSGTDVSMTSASGINEDIVFSSKTVSFSPVGAEQKVWTLIRESKDKISIQLLNLVSNNSYWNQPKQKNIEVTDIEMRVKINRVIHGIYCASPDHLMKAISLDFYFESTKGGREYFVKIPKLVNWNTVWIEME